MCKVPVRSVEHVFSVESMVCGYYEYQNALDTHESLSYEREVVNIHDTFAGSHQKGW